MAGTPAELAVEDPGPTGVLTADRQRFAAFWARADALLAALPAKAERSVAQAEAAAAIRGAADAARERFLATHAIALYDELTADRSRFLRVEQVCAASARAVTGLLPGAAELAAEAARLQRDKQGLEIAQAALLARVLADPQAGAHLCHAMLLPLPASVEAAARFARDGVLDLGPARLHREGASAVLTAGNPTRLNAEDDTTLDAMETAVDVAILDPGSQIAVLRGAPLAHPKYAGRRVLGAGINLTDLYRGRIPYLWFLRRDMGYLHKLLRGVASPVRPPCDLTGGTREKPWIAAVDGFAIGGHCQLLLAVDWVIAADDAFLTLPARKEGIVPGLANLRLPRIAGDRLARQLVQAGRRLECDSPEGRLICDEVVPAAAMDAAIARAAADLTAAGPASFVANRRALRLGAEPLDLFRRYCALYAREQAACIFSPAMIANLERNWTARSRG